MHEQPSGRLHLYGCVYMNCAIIDEISSYIRFSALISTFHSVFNSRFNSCSPSSSLCVVHYLAHSLVSHGKSLNGSCFQETFTSIQRRVHLNENLQWTSSACHFICTAQLLNCVDVHIFLNESRGFLSVLLFTRVAMYILCHRMNDI